MKKMQIKCPECGFDREIDESQIPANSSFATCPKCRTRFRFRAAPDNLHDNEGNELPSAAPKADAAREDNKGDIWDGLDKMRHDWDKTDREEEKPEPRIHGEPRREEADRAYRQAAAQGNGIPFYSTVGSVPWEYKGGFLNPIVFLRTAMLMLTRIPQFFSGINPFSSIIPAWVFFMVTRCISTLAYVHTPMPPVEGANIPDLQAILSEYNMFMIIVVFVSTFTAIHFLGTFIVNFILRMQGGNKANFRLTFKVIAYAEMPAMFAAIPGIGGSLSLFLTLLLLFSGMRHAYGLGWGKAVLTALPYLLLPILLLLLMLQAMIASGALSANFL